MRLLVLDHFFDQDIAALRAAAGERVEIDVMSYEEPRFEALRVFPIEVATGFEPFARPDWQHHRDAFAVVLRELLEDRFTRTPFDAFVSPSDIFFYVRAAPAACRGLGVPFVVVQKETTVTDGTLREHAGVVRRYAPPICDHMTVCSERQRRFWTAAGAAPEQITITGQPRFDPYARGPLTPVALPYGEGGPVALFLSYHVDAYHPSEGAGGAVWRQLHAETEARLAELVARGWRVLIKPHPQQAVAQLRADLHAGLARALGERVFIVGGDLDVRELMRGSDVVIGFQTTALLEAMVLERPVVYTGWDAEADRLTADLLPFGSWDDAIEVARSPDDFVARVEAAPERARRPEVAERRRAHVGEHLGPLDGHASERVLAVVAEQIERFAAARTPAVERHRAALNARRPPLRLRRRTRIAARTARRRVGAVLGR